MLRVLRLAVVRRRLRAPLTSGLLALAALCPAGCDRPPSASPSPAPPTNPVPVSASAPVPETNPALSDAFLGLMNAGKNHLDQGDATNALAVYRRAEGIAPSDVDLRLNLANAHLLAGDAREAIREADRVLDRDPNSAAAYFVKGSAQLRAMHWEPAAISLENARKIDPGETATLFQLGRARLELRQWDAAIAAFREGIAMDPNHLHATVHYLLAQALLRAGRTAEAQLELEQHQVGADHGGSAVTFATFERCRFTQARVPFRLDQPDPTGVDVRFVEATRETLGEDAARWSGPVALVDPEHTGRPGLFVLEQGEHFRLLRNRGGTFEPTEPSYPALPGARYHRIRVGDLRNDRFEDIVALGDRGIQVFDFTTNAPATDASGPSRIAGVPATDGLLMDLDFTGKLDLIAVTGTSNDVRVYRQSGPLQFEDRTGASGIPDSLRTARTVAMEDWNRDGHLDLIVGRDGGAPLLLEKQRGGPLVPRAMTNWVAGTVFCLADFDNDLRPDLAVAADDRLVICFNDGRRREIAATGPTGFRQIVAVDYDNDGWLDLWTAGTTVRAWRNLGLPGFQERTAALGLDVSGGGPATELHFADFDDDCDLDAIVALADGGLRYLRNEGAQANGLVRVRLTGNRSNASGLGCRVEIQSGGLRLLRTVHQLPVEIGVGEHRLLDSFLVHWFNWPQGTTDVPVDCHEPVLALELTIQEGSCPYLYAWDGTGFRFVTDVLGAAPLGLPVAEGQYVEADPEEFVWIGDDRAFPARDGHYEVRITEELREVLYLDEAKLVVVDHEAGTEVHPTDKLLPAGPFPPGTLLTLHREQPLRHAATLEGREVTADLRHVDGRRVSPPRLRGPHLRGLAEPHGLTLDFGPVDLTRPWVLVLNGWLRFGGGMANIAASHDPALPFPFPTLEAEVAPGTWKPVDVTVGAPAGKTKTILVDLEGKLPPGTRRLRLRQAYELHWDRIALLEKQPDPASRITFLTATGADLRFRGYGRRAELPPDCPITPLYDNPEPNPYWTVIPGGWCTRHGDVLELVTRRDEGLALIHAGDELRLTFATHRVPAKPSGRQRDFFLYLDGWDKDSDFHVAQGTEIGPLPFHGMRDADYGRETRPPFPSDALHRKYNTRWVESRVLRTIVRR